MLFKLFKKKKTLEPTIIDLTELRLEDYPDKIKFTGKVKRNGNRVTLISYSKEDYSIEQLREFRRKMSEKTRGKN